MLGGRAEYKGITQRGCGGNQALSASARTTRNAISSNQNIPGSRIRKAATTQTSTTGPAARPSYYRLVVKDSQQSPHNLIAITILRRAPSPPHRILYLPDNRC